MVKSKLEQDIIDALEARAAEHGIDVVDVEIVGATKAHASAYAWTSSRGTPSTSTRSPRRLHGFPIPSRPSTPSRLLHA